MKVLFFNYFLTAIRHIRRSKLYAAVTVLGLSVGLAAVLLIAIYIRTESYYDHFHALGERIYRVSSRSYLHGQLEEANTYVMMAVAGPALKAELPDIEEYTCMSTSYNVMMRHALNEPLTLKKVHYADTNFLRFFSFDLLEGDARTALADPFSIILTQKYAQQYFGDDEPMGKTLQSLRGRIYTVTGVA